MNPRVKEILIDLAERSIRERNDWKCIYRSGNCYIDPIKVTEHRRLCKEKEKAEADAIPELIELGHTVYTVMINGCAPSDSIGNYGVEEKAIKKFGERILPDSERSQLWIMTTEADKDEVLAFIRETAGEGDVRYNDGIFESSHFEAYTVDNPHISGLGSWNAAAKLLEKLKSIHYDW